MALSFPPPPTYAEPTIVDQRTGKAQFNPIWLKWFLDVAQTLAIVAGNSSGGAINHEGLAGLQGGAANDHFHFTEAQFRLTLFNPMTDQGDLIVGGADGYPTRLPIGTPGQVLKSQAGGVLVWS